MLTSYNPYKNYLKSEELLAPFDALISDFLNHSGFNNIPKEMLSKGTYPKCNVYKDSVANTLVIEAGVPGLTKEDINIEVTDNVLSINFKSIAEKRNYVIRELKKSASTRSFFLNEDFDTNAITASVKNGLLKIEIKKKQHLAAKDQTKKIKIQ